MERNSVFFYYNVYGPNNAISDPSVPAHVIHMFIGDGEFPKPPKWAILAAKTKLEKTLREIIPVGNIHPRANDNLNLNLFHAHMIPIDLVSRGAHNNYILVELRKNMTQREINALKNNLRNVFSEYGEVNIARKFRVRGGRPVGNPRTVKSSITKHNKKPTGN
tara:strand:+ start:411 stop:899 length:489 start_codon:yes stop_codon:yes gene_type:complete